MVKFYGYDKCSTCRNAKKWLDVRGIEYESIDITTKPPSQATLKAIISSDDYELKHLFNTSGQLYRQMDIKSKLPDMTQAAAIKLLADNGKLIKRPLVTDGKKHTVGFKEESFEKAWAED